MPDSTFTHLLVKVDEYIGKISKQFEDANYISRTKLVLVNRAIKSLVISSYLNISLVINISEEMIDLTLQNSLDSIGEVMLRFANSWSNFPPG